MTVNVVDAILNIIKTNKFSLKDIYISNNRANSMGLALEKYIMDSFADAIIENDEKIRKQSYPISYHSIWWIRSISFI